MKATAKVAAVAAGLAMATSMLALAPVAHAQTACSVGTVNLTVGSTGAAVTCLQQGLIAKGHSIPAGATGYFGAQTKAAVMAWQTAAGVSPAAGYFGPISRAAWMGTTGGAIGGTSTVPGCTSTSGFSPTTGQSCASTTSTVAGCSAGDLFSRTTGMACGTTGGTPTGLTGAAGSVESFTAISSLSGEEVGESETVEIAGVEVEADSGSDLALTAVRLDFSTQPGNDDLQDFITEVMIKLDGKVVATVDADEFNNDNEWTKTVSLSSGAIILKGETKDLTVAVTGVNNVDSDDAGDDWALDFLTVRYVDAQGASITDTVTYTPVTWDVNTFATAVGVELKVTTGVEAVNESHVINVDDTDETSLVSILSFNLEAEGSDITIDDFPINFDISSTTGNIDSIASTVYLFADGVEVGSESMTATAGADETITFDNIDYTIDKDDTVAFLVKADFNDTDAATFDEGTTISAQVSATERNAIVADDSTGERIADADATGTAVGEAHSLYDIGISVEFVSNSETMTPGADGTIDDDTVTLKLVFDVTAFDGTVYVSNSATPTTAADGAVTAIDVDDGGVLYRYEIDGTATVSLMSDAVSKVDSTGTVDDDAVDEYTFTDGEKTRVTLTVTRANAAAEALSDGYHELQLVAIGWSTTQDDDTMNVYEFNLDVFKTDPIFAN